MRSMSRLSIQLLITDALLAPISLFIASYLRSHIPIGTGGALPPTQTSWPLAVYLLATVLWPGALFLNGAYDPQKALRWFNEASRVLWSTIVATVLMAGFLYMTFRQVSRLQFVYFLLVNLSFLLGYRTLLRITYRLQDRTRPGAENRILIVGAGDLGLRVARTLRDHSRWGFNLTGFLDDDNEKQGKRYEDVSVLGRILDVQSVAQEKKIHEVWIALPIWAMDRVNLIVTEVEKLPVRVKVIPDYFSMALVQAKPEIMAGIPLIGLREPVIEGPERVIKRIFDLVITLISLIIAGPLMLLIASVVWADTRGPILFRQKRYGENGRIFEMLKFRTMRVGAEEEIHQVARETKDGNLIHKQPNDPRVTRAGKFLRRYSLDELPQLLNVLKGDMSLVGPRPELPWLVDRYDSWQRKRFAVPQGITGWWQINGRSDKPMHLHTEDDLYYVYNYSLWLDVQILLRTPWVVMRGRGAF
jgi:exopolysaccharide biosynthesis polyprenyl glycosylphosphotransferase